MMPESPRTLRALVVTLGFVLACDNATGPRVSALVIATSAVTMTLGDTILLHASPLDEDGSDVRGVSVAWSASDTTVIQVDTAGQTWGVGEGNAWVVARAAGLADSVAMTITLRRIGLQTFIAVDAGASHACMLNSANEAYCVGMNGSGELGDGNTINRDYPYLADIGEGVARISAGDRHSCAIG